MKTYAILDNSAITSHGTPDQLWPEVSFPSVGVSPEFLAARNAVPISHDFPHNSETHYLRSVDPYVLDGEVFNREPVERPHAPLVPKWVEFGAALAADAQVNAMVGAAAADAPVLHLMLGVGLGQAAQGDPKTFAQAWGQGLAGGLISAELAAHVAQLAGPFDLPPEFVAGLTSLP